ncbi:unnamed protein product [Linum tenue]|uniref:Uncharacterized protein n=1 Tax=Linum tenue TaxID=586396 RepID=A0AAV0IU07_9ROSI|nr:unnamed protein product [Linum tenue]
MKTLLRHSPLSPISDSAHPPTTVLVAVVVVAILPRRRPPGPGDDHAHGDGVAHGESGGGRAVFGFPGVGVVEAVLDQDRLPWLNLSVPDSDRSLCVHLIRLLAPPGTAFLRKQVLLLQKWEYEVEPPHALITATAAGNRLYLFNVTANGLQWKRHYPELKKIADSFRVV